MGVRRALETAASVDGLDAAATGAWLYAYGRRPLTAGWSDTIRAAGGAASYVGMDRARAADVALPPDWSADDGADPAWLRWRRVVRGRPARPTRRATFKLYVAPAPEAMPRVVAAALVTIARSRAFGFKIAATPAGLLRPDKLVAYFHTRRALNDAARALAIALGAPRVQPVPFTARLDARGLLSWGMDPPGVGGADTDATRSWRAWVTSRLGRHLVAARAETTSPSRRATRALSALARDGVDVARWAPIAPCWRAASA